MRFPALDLDDFRNTCGEGESPLLTTIRSVLGRSKTIGHVTGIKKPQKSSVALPTETDELNVIGPIRGEEIEYCEEPFRGDAKDCNRYYQCIFGRYVEQRCPPGTVWNSVSSTLERLHTDNEILIISNLFRFLLESM